VPIDFRNVVNLRNGQFDSTTRAQLDQLFDGCLADGTGKLAVHFHGGLVGEGDAMALAERLLPEYRQANVAYPMFFVWESGLLEILRNNVGEILREDFFQILLRRALSFVAGKVRQQIVGGRIAAVTPESVSRVRAELDKVENGDPSWTDLSGRRLASVSEVSPAEAIQFQQLLEADPDFMREVALISSSIEPADTAARSRGMATAGSRKTLISPEVLADVERERSQGLEGARGFLPSPRLIRGAVKVAVRAISRFRNKRDHGFHATVVEEIFREFYVSAVGREVWRQMKQDTADAFQENAGVFGGTAFLARLRELEQEGKAPRVTLIGHSAGSEYVCNLLQHAADHLSKSFTFDVIFLAPACRIERFAQVLQRHGKRIGNFRCFTMTDELEQADRLIPVIYPHSLLYFVSGVLEDEADKPLLGMERYLRGTARHYKKTETGIPTVKTFLAGGANRLLLSIADAGPGLATNSVKHGGFDDTSDAAARATIDSVRHILKHGF